MKLSETKVRAAAARARSYKLGDGRGLYLLVQTNGSKLWRFDYRFDDRRRTLALGSYPEIALEKAREGRDAARELLREERDPMQERKIARIAAKYARANTFGLVADEVLARLAREQKAGVTIDKRRWLLKTLAASLEHRPIAAITPIEIVEVLREVEEKGHLESARRLRAAIGQVMRLAVATNRAQSDPTPALRGAIATPKVTHRAAITDKKGAGRLMLAIESYDRAVVRSAMQIMAYCFPRPGECRLAQWGEIDFEQHIWTIPAARTKMRRDHKIPLSRQALAVFEQLHTLTAPNGALCFPGQRPKRPISENTICLALRLMGFAMEEMSAHGFRALASTLLHEQSDFSSQAIERALGHQDANAIRRAYARGAHWDERVRMMQWWADYLDGLKDSAVSTSAVG